MRQPHPRGQTITHFYSLHIDHAHTFRLRSTTHSTMIQTARGWLQHTCC